MHLPDYNVHKIFLIIYIELIQKTEVAVKNNVTIKSSNGVARLFNKMVAFLQPSRMDPTFTVCGVRTVISEL